MLAIKPSKAQNEAVGGNATTGLRKLPFLELICSSWDSNLLGHRVSLWISLRVFKFSFKWKPKRKGRRARNVSLLEGYNVSGCMRGQVREAKPTIHRGHKASRSLTTRAPSRKMQTPLPWFSETLQTGNEFPSSLKPPWVVRPQTFKEKFLFR